MTQPLSSLAALKAAGAVLGDAPKPVTVKWANDVGEEFSFNILVRPMSFGASLDFSGKKDRKSIAEAISALVLLDDGNGGHVSLSYDDAIALHPRLGWSIFEVISPNFTKKK